MEKTERLTILQTRFPNLGIRLSPTGTLDPHGPTHRVVTNLTDANGGAIGFLVDDEFDVDEVSLRMLSFVVHRARKARDALEACPCAGCIAKRLRKYERQRIDPDPPQEMIERIDAKGDKDDG